MATYMPAEDDWLHPRNIRASYERELARMLKAREELFDELDRFPRNAKLESKHRRMEREIMKLKLSIRDLYKFD